MGIIAMIKGEEPGLVKQLAHLPKGKGHFGEYLTEYALEHGNIGAVAVFSNVIVPRDFGPTSTSEVDVVMLHEKGVFVIESKNYSGWIFGSPDQRDWTATLNPRAKERFYNPIKQNRSHVKALSRHLGLEPGAFQSFIVFSERCEFKEVPPDTDEYAICHRGRLLARMRKRLDRLDPVFGDAELERLKAALAELAGNSTREARSAHVEEVKRVASGEACPWCGSELVERNGRYGPFTGCSAYPKCRFTRDR